MEFFNGKPDKINSKLEVEIEFLEALLFLWR